MNANSCCPPWCVVSHRFDPLEPFHTGPTRAHVQGVYPSQFTTARVSVGKVDPFDVVVELALTDDGMTLPPARAREIGHALIEAASWAEDHQDD